MRRLAITGFCAIALMSGCDGERVGVDKAGAEPQKNDITLPCRGKGVDTGEWPAKIKETLFFHTDGRCKFTYLQFKGYEQPPPDRYPPGFSKRTEHAGGKTISYDYDGTTPIPATGYKFNYKNDDPNDPQDGNGSGVIK
jgi:hypothetical protein